MIDVEHDGRNLTVDILLLAPVIGDQNDLCVVERLTSLKFNISGKCFTGPVKINSTLINDLDEKFQLYDNQLSAVRRKADSLIDQIEETFDSSYVEYVAFTALGLSITNFIVFCVLCRCIFRYSVPRSHDSPLQLPPQPLPEPEPSSGQQKTCHRCAKPVKKRTPSEVKEKVAVAER